MPICGGLTSGFHDTILILGKDHRERESKGLRYGEDRREGGLALRSRFELRKGISVTFDIGKNVGAQSRRDEDGEMGGGKRVVTCMVDLVPNGKLVTGHIVQSTGTTGRRDSAIASVVQMCMPESGGEEDAGDVGWRREVSIVEGEDATNNSLSQQFEEGIEDAVSLNNDAE